MSSQLQGMEAEAVTLRNELSSLAAMLASGDAEVDELERSILRQQACRMRLQAVDAKIAAERARIAQEAAAAAKAEAKRQAAAGDAAMLKIAGQLERMIDDARAAHALFSQAAGEYGGLGLDQRGYIAIREMTKLAQRVAPGVYDVRLNEASGTSELYRRA